MIEIVILGNPIPWKAAVVTKNGAFSPRHLEKKFIRAQIASQYKGPILDVLISCSMIFFMPVPTGTSKKKKALMLDGKIRPGGTPDRTNMLKLYEDCLQGIVIKKDSKIVEGDSKKFYGSPPRTVIHIKEIPTCS